MPGYDGTGPEGRGPMTGRGMGPCGRGFGRGFGRGRGRGFGRWFGLSMPAFAETAYEPTKEEQAQMLAEEAKAIEEEQKALKEELEYIKKKLKELKK